MTEVNAQAGSEGNPIDAVALFGAQEGDKDALVFNEAEWAGILEALEMQLDQTPAEDFATTLRQAAGVNFARGLVRIVACAEEQRCRQLALTSLLSASGLAPEVGHPQLLRSAEAVAAIVSTISVMNAEATATEECLYSLVAISEACGWAEGAHGVEQEIAALVTQATPAVLACLDADNEQIVMAATSAVAHMAGLEKLPGRTAWVASVRAHANARFLGESLLQLLNRSRDHAMARRLLLAVSDLLERVHGAPAGDQAGSVCKGSKCDADILYLSDVRVLTGICIERCNGDEPSEVRSLMARCLGLAVALPGIADDAKLVGDVRAALERMMEGRAGSLDAAGLAAEETLLAHIDVLDPPGGLRY